jgi:Transposase DDE domain/Transposase domain (DUF772)
MPITLIDAVGEQGGGVFRRSDSQGSLFQTSNLLPDDKRQRLERDWPGQFRQHALPLIDEEQFRELYCADNGRPNKPVRLVAGVLVLKEMFDLTDAETLDSVDYDLRWQVALDQTPEEAHCCQKTLHNFRAKLLGNEKARLLFTQMTDGMLKHLGLSAEKQRLDSTHILSNIARLSRLRLFCETARLFLRELKERAREKFQGVSESLRRRYLKEDGEDSPYHDAKSSETQRRLKVCARDAYRLVAGFKGDPEVLQLHCYQVLARLFFEQCELRQKAAAPEPDDADAQEAAVPVVLKESKEVSSASLQSPHDVAVTYSGHKGKGYEVQVAETVGNGEKPELITHVEVTPSCQSDEAATVPTVEALAQREIQPKELITDTNYASAANVMACEERGTEVVAPVKGPAAETPKENEKTLADFTVDEKAAQPLLCPAGHAPERMERQENGSISATFARLHCAQCPFRKTCPAQRNPNGTRTLKTTTKEHLLARRRRYEQTEEFRKRYAERAGIEATNSELKRAHGMGFLRVRGGARVRLAVYFKALACNVKRMVVYFAQQAKKSAKAPGQMTEQAAAGPKPAAAALFGCLHYSGAPWHAVHAKSASTPLALAA